ncbi:MAG: GNAT family N-acetyltransferase [Herminiimonas sp.]|nr:GNAT family N-acetyltransferase [Herminiimonas sp.]
MNVIVREAESDDAALMAELTRNAWEHTVAASSSGHHEAPDRVTQHLRDGGGYILFVDDQPAGSVRWLPVEGDSDVWEIARMGVTARYRGESLSLQLLEAVIHRALAADIKELRLAVRTEQARVVDLYAAYGFELAPELEYGHANPDEPPPVVMRRWL